eukprot:10588135-Prorocentrum_lima.AAC.1
MHVHKMSLRAKDNRGVWQRHPMGLISNLPESSFAQLTRCYFPSKRFVEKPSQVYDFPTCLNEPLYIHI